MDYTLLCITCMFYPNLGYMLSAFIVLVVIILIFSMLATRRYQSRIIANPGFSEKNALPLMAAATVLGIGIGGFIDGIVLHQILQWHEMLTNKLPANTLVNKSINMFWDGIFHLFTLITTTIGVFLLWNLLNKKNINYKKRRSLLAAYTKNQ